ncbi:MAG TPA: 6-phosphogluconolactonase [Bacteroidales bacterium]|nr:6-phosphogluconolactonase [Bacteroidales bacterium]
MENSQILVFETMDEMALNALQWLTDKTSEKGRETVSIALSGGNTPQALFESIVKLDTGTVDWNKLMVFWGDERCVPPEHTESNFRSAQKSFLIPLDIPQEHIFRIRGEIYPPKEAERYTQVLSEHLPIVDGYPKFDLIILGLGEDGHTASIFPGDESLFETEKWCEVSTHPISGKQRITLTGSVINHAEEVAFLVTGTNKAKIVAEIALSPEKVVCPAARVLPFSGNITWLLDKAAASQL